MPIRRRARPAQAGPTEPPWHVFTAEEVADRLGTRRRGLRTDEVAERVKLHGPNVLPSRPPAPLWVSLLAQFRSPLIYVLIAAAAVSALLGHMLDAVFIAVVLLINAAIGGVQEWRAERGMQALKGMLQVVATVERSGEVRQVPAQGLVPGDVVLLESGNRVPADVRLWNAHGFQVDQAFLTGESMGVDKDAGWVGTEDVAVADRANMAHAGAIVLRGRAQGVVVATGTRTEVGRIATAVMGTETAEAPLLTRMRRLTRFIGHATVAIVVVLAILGAAQGQPLESVFLFGVGLAVSAIPEGLPVALTIVLAIGTRRMSRRNVLVRRLASVEGLGSCTVIATDKTGTLTRNEITVRQVRLPDGRVLDVTGNGYEPEGGFVVEGDTVGQAPAELADLMRSAALCNEATLRRTDDAWTHTGDPTDVALLVAARKAGVQREDLVAEEPQVNDIPFEPERRYAAAYHQGRDGVRVHVKGAPERVLAMCFTSPADDDAVQWWERQVAEMASEGMRVLAVAEGATPGVTPDAAPEAPTGLHLVGLVGMIDPPREGVQEAIGVATRAGVRVVMITGDHPQTALAIARQLGIADEGAVAVTGHDIDANPSALPRLVAGHRVFARITPEHKTQIVRALQEAGDLVAVTGDGVNDAPALRAANIGVAMGASGTDVARETADVVLADDNFASIVNGIEEGRIAYTNVRKVVLLLLSTGAAEVVLVFLALTTGNPVPLLPAQFLWLNLVTNGIQHVGLAMEPAEGDEMSRPPRPPTQRIFESLMIQRTLIGAAVMGSVGFLAFDWMLDRGWTIDAARNGLLLLMVLFENVYIGNCRSESKSAFALSPMRNPMLLGAALLAQGVHLAALWTPGLSTALRAQPVTLETWATLAAVSLVVIVPFELHKLWMRRRALRPGWPHAAA